MALFTADTRFVVFMNAEDSKPSMELHSREALAPVFAELNKYDATTHFVGQSTIFSQALTEPSVDDQKRRARHMALRSAWAEWCERNSNSVFVCVSRTVRETQMRKRI
jgi:hypothetical protein